ncbi:acyltransferase [Paraglaciecola sp.]|uniref:acyltransferase n=1 Tax=Paraglaciecola sp. TaxID=1920173 RepID=UPI003263951C
MSQRIEYFDVLRGLAIIAVVAIHSSVTGLQFSEQSFNFNFTVFWRNLLNFAVPLFIAISGYFLANKQLSSAAEYTAFLKRQIPKVLIPAAIWSCIYCAFSLVVLNRPLNQELFKLVTFQASIPFYFIALIIQLYLLLPLLLKFSNLTGLLFSIILSLLSALLIFYLRYYTQIDLPIIIYAGNFASWLMFFMLGLCYGKGKINISNKVLVSLTIAFYLLSCVESIILIEEFHQAGDASSAIKVSSFLYSFFLIILMFGNANLTKSRLLSDLGQVSFGVYLVHMLVITILVKVLTLLVPSLQGYAVLFQITLLTLTLLTSFTSIKFVNRVIKNRLTKLIGFS